MREIKVIVEADLDIDGVDERYVAADIATEPDDAGPEEVMMALALALWDEAKRATGSRDSTPAEVAGKLALLFEAFAEDERAIDDADEED